MALRPQRHREMLSRPRNAQCLRAPMAATKRVSFFCSLIILSVFSGRREPIQTPALCCPGIGKLLCYHSKGCTRKQEACVLKWRNAQRVGGLVCFPFLFFFLFFFSSLVEPHHWRKHSFHLLPLQTHTSLFPSWRRNLETCLLLSGSLLKACS